MAKYLIDSTDIEIEEVSGTENLKFNLASGNSAEQMIGDLSNLTTTSKSNLVNALNEVNNSTIYSTTETRIGTYNGENLYRKIINFGSLPNATTKYVNHGITNLKDVVNLKGSFKYNGIRFSVPYVYPDTTLIEYWITFTETSDTQIGIITGIDRSEYNGYVIIEYTKN